MSTRNRMFQDFLDEHDIEDMQLMPSSLSLERMYLRVTRFNLDKGPLPLDTLMSNLCEYVYTDYCGPRVKGLKKVSLDGDA